MREDGKFVINGDIPEGQGSVTELLSECFDMAYELRNEAEEHEDNKTPHDDTDGDHADVDDDPDTEVDEDDDLNHMDDEEGMSLARTVSRKPGTGPVGVSIGVK